jgi:holo-[acyl-carrier protein] synthase
MILGVGLDLCPIERMQRALERSGSRFSQKVFTEAERAYCSARGQPAQHFAARFAAKEAVSKRSECLRVYRGTSWRWSRLQAVRPS